MKQKVLRPGDVVVLLAVAIDKHSGISVVAERSGRSVGEAHGAVGRLTRAGLVDAETGGIDRESVLRFLEWGVPFAYPPQFSAPTVGVATALLDPGEGGIAPAYVWPAADGTSMGDALEPLHPRVPDVSRKFPRLWRALSLVDLIRVGGVADRQAATTALRMLIAGSAA